MEIHITGTIVRRRSLGKYLAFCDVLIESSKLPQKCIGVAESTTIDAGESSKQIDGQTQTIYSVAFRRSSPSWDTDFDDTFPIKASSLPFGALVEMDLITEFRFKEDEMKNVVIESRSIPSPFPQEKDTNSLETSATHYKVITSKDHKWEVQRWKIKLHPHATATERAQTKCDQGGHVDISGISCSKYFQSRGEDFLKYNQHHTRPKVKRKVEHPQNYGENNIGSQSTEDQFIEAEGYHGDKKAKALRAKIFASWLVETFGSELLSQKCGVLDIAGGKGQLSVELAVLGQVQCTIIDPLIRGKYKDDQKECQIQRIASKQLKRIQKANAPIPKHVAKPFSLEDNYSIQIATDSSCLVGLHPDECTEAILDAALKCNKPFAIVPCCVFPGFFPLRKLRNEKAVRTHHDFMEYLLEKDPRLKRDTLMFRGKNQVIYCK